MVSGRTSRNLYVWWNKTMISWRYSLKSCWIYQFVEFRLSSAVFSGRNLCRRLPTFGYLGQSFVPARFEGQIDRSFWVKASNALGSQRLDPKLEKRKGKGRGMQTHTVLLGGHCQVPEPVAPVAPVAPEPADHPRDLKATLQRASVPGAPGALSAFLAECLHHFESGQQYSWPDWMKPENLRDVQAPFLWVFGDHATGGTMDEAGEGRKSVTIPLALSAGLTAYGSRVQWQYLVGSWSHQAEGGVPESAGPHTDVDAVLEAQICTFWQGERSRKRLVIEGQ